MNKGKKENNLSLMELGCQHVRVAKIQEVNVKRFQSDTCQEGEKNAKNGELKFWAGGRNRIDRKARESLTENMAVGRDLNATGDLALCLFGEGAFQAEGREC